MQGIENYVQNVQNQTVADNSALESSLMWGWDSLAPIAWANENAQMTTNVASTNVAPTTIAPVMDDPTFQNVVPVSQEPPVVQQPVVQPPRQPEPPVVPTQPPQEPPQPNQPATAPQSTNLEELDSAINDLLADINKGGGDVWASVVPNEPPKEVDETTKSKDVNDNWKVSLDKDEGISTEVNDLKEKLVEFDLKLREAQIKNQYLEQQLEKKAWDESQMYEKFKNLERDLKKHKAWQIDVDVQKLNDYVKLHKESDTLYNERGVLSEASKLIENITKLDMNPYLMEYYKTWNWFNKESGSNSEPVVEKPIGDWKMWVINNSFL